MHPVGPWTEANHLYVNQTELPRRLQLADEIRCEFSTSGSALAPMQSRR